MKSMRVKRLAGIAVAVIGLLACSPTQAWADNHTGIAEGDVTCFGQGTSRAAVGQVEAHASSGTYTNVTSTGDTQFFAYKAHLWFSPYSPDGPWIFVDRRHWTGAWVYGMSASGGEVEVGSNTWWDLEMSPAQRAPGSFRFPLNRGRGWYRVSFQLYWYADRTHPYPGSANVWGVHTDNEYSNYFNAPVRACYVP